MKNDVSRSLFSYWNGLRGARSAPERSCIDPSAIRHILAHTFIIEVDAAASFPFRVAGTRVNALFGADLKSVKYASLFTWPGGEPDREGAALPLLVCDDMSPVVAGIDATTRSGREVCLELLLLPLRHHGKTHSRVLGCLTPGAMPVWYGLDPVVSLFMRSCRVVLPAEIGAGSPSIRRVGAPERVDAVRRKHLFVYQGGQSQSEVALSSPG
jgi:hypothetical protein